MPVMSKQLNVSYRTLRRTLCILDSLSIIRLHQGKVSDVCEDIEQIDFQRPEVKEGFRLYRESLQFMALTVRPVFLYTLEHVEKEDLEKLRHGFIQLLNENQSERCFSWRWNLSSNGVRQPRSGSAIPGWPNSWSGDIRLHYTGSESSISTKNTHRWSGNQPNYWRMTIGRGMRTAGRR